MVPSSTVAAAVASSRLLTSSAPSRLYGEPDLTVRVVRDLFNEDFEKLIVSGEEAWDTVEQYVDMEALASLRERSEEMREEMRPLIESAFDGIIEELG